jgi:hypothetical protein
MGASCLSWTLVQPEVAQFARAKRRPRVLQIFRERFEALVCERMLKELLENFERHRADVWETYLLGC